MARKRNGRFFLQLFSSQFLKPVFFLPISYCSEKRPFSDKRRQGQLIFKFRLFSNHLISPSPIKHLREGFCAFNVIGAKPFGARRKKENAMQ